MASRVLNADYAFLPDPSHVHRCRKTLLERVKEGAFTPTCVVTRRMHLAKAIE